MNYDKIKNRVSEIFFGFFWVGNGFLINKAYHLKWLIVLILTAMLIGALVFDKRRICDSIRLNIICNKNSLFKKIAIIITFLAWFIFSSGFFLANLGFALPGKCLILTFVLLIIISFLLTIYYLEQSGNQKVKNTRWIIWGATSFSYAVFSSFSASWFLKLSNLEIDQSPLVELGWKLTFFSMYYFMFFQFVTYCISLNVLNSVKVDFFEKTVALSFLCVTTFLMLGMNQWNMNIIVHVLDFTTKFEWHEKATCGTSVISEPTEHYFGFNSDKYTVYFSNRGGKWGFEELKCEKTSQKQNFLPRILVSQFAMPK